MKALTVAAVAGMTAAGVVPAYCAPPVDYGELVYSVALSQGQLYYTSYTDGVTRVVLRSVTRTAGAYLGNSIAPASFSTAGPSPCRCPRPCRRAR